MLAPIILFAFNRLEPLKATVQSLLRNDEAADSPLYIFVDGPRAHHEGEAEKVAAVRKFAEQVTGFKSVNCQFSESNQGLGPSIIPGVSKVIEEHGRAIVVEDDLIVANNFLSFLNQGLNLYEHTPEVFSVCGYSNEVKVPADYHADAYFCTRSSSWGWATWADRWKSVDWDLKDWNHCRLRAKEFNQWGGSDCWGMLNGWKLGRNRSWAIRFCFAQFLQNKVSLFPIISKVQNDGFDGQGTNCKKWSRFRYVFDTEGSKDFTFPLDTTINRRLYRSAMHYNSLLMRVYSRIMYMIHS